MRRTARSPARFIGLVAVLVVLATTVTLVATDRVGPPDGDTSASRSVEAAEVGKRLGQGVNILGDDPGWEAPVDARMQARHYRLIKEAGFDNVRINLHPFPHTPASGRIPESWFQTLDWAMDQALANGLLVVLDLHEYEAMGSDPAANRERFLTAWEQISERYRAWPDEVLFELLNEPSRHLTPALWNEYLRAALTVVRTSNPTRTVIIGPGRSNSIRGLDELKLPPGERNIIMTIHYYEPFEFTHQGAPWVGRQDQVGVHWTGTTAQRQAVRRDFQVADRWAREQDRPLYLGEFGAYEAGDLADRVAWTSFVAREAERFGWSWSYWQFDSDFIVYDIPAEEWVEPIRNALIPMSSPGVLARAPAPP